MQYKQYKVKLGLGRMSNHHKREYIVEATNESSAASVASLRYHQEVPNEIGKDNPIWGKFVTIESVEVIN